MRATPWVLAALAAAATGAGATEIRALEVPKVLCLYGQDETDTVCPELRTTLTAIELPGGHHFGGDDAAIARRILDALGIASAR